MKNISKLLSRMKLHHIDSFSSQIAFYMLLSIFPFLILLFMFLTNLSISIGDQMDIFYRMIPTEASQIIKDYLEYSIQFSNTAFSPLLALAIWMSSNAMVALMKAFNIAYNIDETRNYLMRKLVGMVCTLLTMLLIVSALVIPNIGVALMNYIRRYLEIPEMNIHVFNFVKVVVSGSVFFFVLGSLYFILPNKKVGLKEVVPGTIFSFIGLVMISYFFAYFVKEYSRYSLVYGGLAAVIILMIWLFLCGLILMLGGEINAINYENKIKK